MSRGRRAEARQGRRADAQVRVKNAGVRVADAGVRIKNAQVRVADAPGRTINAARRAIDAPVRIWACNWRVQALGLGVAGRGLGGRAQKYPLLLAKNTPYF